MPRFTPNPLRRPAVVAGASSGIGAATAVAIAEAGHPVALGARRVGECEKVAAGIRESGGEAFVHHLDVGDAGSVKEFVAASAEALGPIEILVSSAGDIEASPIHETDPDRFAEQVGVHLVGAHRLAAEVLPGMIGRRRGDVVFIGSDVAARHRPRMGGYVPSKAAVEAMARTMQMELEGTGVRATLVRPGPTATGMGMNWEHSVLAAVLDDWSKWGFARHSYFLRPADLAAAVCHAVFAPRGVNYALIELQPEAPLQAPPVKEDEA